MDTTRFRTQTRQLKRENYKKGVLPQAIGNAEGTPAHGNFNQDGHRRLQSEDAVLAATAPMLCIVSSANASVNIPTRPGSGSVSDCAAYQELTVWHNVHPSGAHERTSAKRFHCSAPSAKLNIDQASLTALTVMWIWSMSYRPISYSRRPQNRAN